MFARSSPVWLWTFRSYVLTVMLLHGGWEILQLPLYTIWSGGTGRSILFAVLHCTAGDAMIASFSLLLSLLLAGTRDWPDRRFKTVALLTISFGVGYTIFSEWRNTTITQNWAYTAAMPRVFGIGLSPVAQWILIPSGIFWWLQRRLRVSLYRP